jgi:two-component system, NtrC family, sensor kinase
MSDPHRPAHHRILLIDDHPAIHTDYRMVFRLAEPKNTALNDAEAAIFGPGTDAPSGLTFEIDSAFQGEEGLGKVCAAIAEGRPYAMAFIDMRMPPGWDGVETTLRLWEVCPDLQVVICTAHSDYTWEDMIERFGQTDRLVLLKKPFDALEVLQLAHALTEKWRLLNQARAHTAELEQRVDARTRDLNAANEKLQAEMAGRIEVENALRQVQKMEAVGQLAGGVAHDFNNLLSIILGNTDLLLGPEGLAPEQARDSLREVKEAAERAASLTRQLLTFCRKQVVQYEFLDLNEVVGQAIKLLHRVLGAAITIETVEAVNLPVIHADRAMVEQMLFNLAVNARDAMPRGGHILIRSAVAEFGEDAVRHHPLARAGRFVSFGVSDSGCGIAPEIMPRVFEPFFTTKDVGKGTGLGLATVYGIVKQHEGWIEVESAPGLGATFTIFLPASAKPAEELPRHAGATEAIDGKETILLVEDEACLLRVTQMMLQSFGYRVHAVESGVEALKIWPKIGAEIDLLFTDVVMPQGISGPELATRLKGENAGLKVILSSGYSRDLLGQNGVIDRDMHFLPKPYTQLKLANALRACLDGKPGGTVVAA